MSKLLTRDFLLVSAGNFFLFLSFYALMPLLPFFLKEEYGTSGSVVGLILGSYMIACIAIRPIAGYLLDAFSRRPTYLLAYSLFAVIFCGYNMATLLSLFQFQAYKPSNFPKVLSFELPYLFSYLLIKL